MDAVVAWERAQAAGDAIWSVVQPGAMFARPVPERHRLIFYLGHLEAFDWNLLAPLLELTPFRPEWDHLFAFGIDPVDGKLPQDRPQDWPQRAEVESYGREVRRQLRHAITRSGERPRPSTEAVDPGHLNQNRFEHELDERLAVAREHRWMHVETLSYLLHNLDFADKRPGPPPPSAASAARPAATIEIPAGRVTLGKPRSNAADFGWDNEFDEHQVELDGFVADRTKVTNGDYLAFVETGAEPPHFWRRTDGGWMYRGMFAERPLPLDHPVYVTWQQAANYAAWRGQKLPSEAQWHRMAYGTPAGDERSHPWGDAPPGPAQGNFGLRHWDPEPVGAHPAGASAWGVEDLVGNGWEWTSTVFAPFPGFQPRPYYPGYSANFFDGAHYVLKGASARTGVSLIRRSFRNWFQPRYPYLYAGFRLVH